MNSAYSLLKLVDRFGCVKSILYVSDASSVHTRRWAEYYRDQGVQVHVASFRPAVIDGVSVHLLPTFGLGRAGYVLAVRSLRRLAKRLGPDVVHAQYITSYGFVAALAGLHPLVLTAWGSDVLITPRTSRLMFRVTSYTLRHADAITTVAQHMNAAVASLGVPVDDIITIPFGVDTQRFLPPRLPRPNTSPLRVICTRNFASVYSVHTLLVALRDVANRGLCLRVDLVGDGPLRKDLEGLVARAQMGSWVRFHGHVDHNRLAQLLAQANIFVTPALSDGNNVSLNEAMACSCFPIATNIPANAQWLDHGVNGLLYPPGDAAGLATCILQAAGDADLRSRAGIMNRTIVESRADWRVSAARMNATYADAIMHTERQR